MKALSVRQPWAWLIVNGYKTVENRSQNIGRVCGRIYIHASQTLTVADYNACVTFLLGHPDMAAAARALPARQDLDCGGLVGSVNVWAIVKNLEGLKNPWYTGGVGYMLNDAVPLDIFAPCPGRLGFFEVEVV